MNENSTMGFTYNVKHFSPEGEKIEEFDVHNLIPNEGLLLFLNLIFKANGNKGYNWASGKSNERFRLYLMTNHYVPHSGDTYSVMLPNLSKNYLATPYGPFMSNSTDYYSVESRFVSFSLNSDLQGVSSKEFTYTDYGNTKNYPSWKFAAPKLITGVFLCSNISNVYYTEPATFTVGPSIISAALFPSPIQMEKNGELTIKTGFTLISA